MPGTMGGNSSAGGGVVMVVREKEREGGGWAGVDDISDTGGTPEVRHRAIASQRVAPIWSGSLRCAIVAPNDHREFQQTEQSVIIHFGIKCRRLKSTTHHPSGTQLFRPIRDTAPAPRT